MEERNLILSVLFATILLLLITVFITLFIIQYYKRRKVHETEMKEVKVKFEQTLLQSQLEIREQTFHNISQEIHDNVGQVLTLAKINLSKIAVQVTDPGQIKETKELITRAIQDLRDISKSLSTDFIEQAGFSYAIERELKAISKTGVVQTHFNQQGDAELLPAGTKLILFRMVQESLQNSLKHAEAKNIFVEIDQKTTHLEIKIKDDGKGFETETVPTTVTKGLGLQNLANRTKLIGGTFIIDSKLTKGTTITFSIPIHEADSKTYLKN